MFPPASVTLPTINENDLDDVPSAAYEIANPEYRHIPISEAGLWDDGVAAYLATVAFVDAQIGRILDALDKSKYRDNTIIILWSDHGWHLGEKLHWAKNTLWEEATRSPLFVSVPGMTRPGGKCARTVSFIDIYPTLVDLCSLKPKADLEGRSFVPLLKNPQAKWNYPALCTRHRNNHTLRTEKWRYTRYANGSEELYDSVNDPLEWTNLLWGTPAPEHRAIADTIAKWLPKINN
jgi:arylsulfatase A-like enzyme